MLVPPTNTQGPHCPPPPRKSYLRHCVLDKFRWALKSLARISSPALAWKSSGFAPILLAFFAHNGHLKNSRGLQSPPPPPPPALSANYDDVQKLLWWWSDICSGDNCSCDNCSAEGDDCSAIIAPRQKLRRNLLPTGDNCSGEIYSDDYCSGENCSGDKYSGDTCSNDKCSPNAPTNAPAKFTPTTIAPAKIAPAINTPAILAPTTNAPQMLRQLLRR